MKQWQVISQKSILKTVPFEVEELHLQSQTKNESAIYHRLVAPDWINVLALTADHKAIMVRQSRIGILQDTLETPGGCVDPHEKDATMTALRELEEETGFTTSRILPVATLPANPAVYSNLVHYFVAFNCHPVSQRRHFPDAHEEITLEVIPYHELDGLIRTGQIKNPYSALNILLSAKYIKSRE